MYIFMLNTNLMKIDLETAEKVLKFIKIHKKRKYLFPAKRFCRKDKILLKYS